MCLIAFANNVHPDYQLILVANRDESYERPSAPMNWWEDHPNILGGRDGIAGGTWFAVSKDGRWAAVTNFRGPKPKHGSAVSDKLSRGKLISNYLVGDDQATEFIEKNSDRIGDYGGFNLLVGDQTGIYWTSNRRENGQEPDADSVEVQKGVFGLSNHLLDTPWPKVELAKRNLRTAIEKESLTPNDLFQVLNDPNKPPDEKLPDTGVGIELERILGPMFITCKERDYGTRCTTVLLISNNGKVQVAERSFPDSIDRHFDFLVT